MAKNANLSKAKGATQIIHSAQIGDIERELINYKDHFKGKVVFCNCDDPEESNFWKYFSEQFDHLGLKKLISIHYRDDRITYKLEITQNDNEKSVTKTMLRQNGDFRSTESVAVMDEADIVVTNPPFSKFREFISLLMDHKKKFLVIGNLNAITYKEVFYHIRNNELWLGHTAPKEFVQPDGTIKKFGNIKWFTNLETTKRPALVLTKSYVGNENDYIVYDYFDAINVNKVADIPYDYEGVMGVPVTFLDKHNPDQFEIIGCTYDHGRPIGWDSNINMNASVRSKSIYKRLLIVRKKDFEKSAICC